MRRDTLRITEREHIAGCSRRRREHAAAAGGQRDLAGRQACNGEHAPVASVGPDRDRGDWHDGRPIALKGQCGGQPNAVELRQGPQRDTVPSRYRVDEHAHCRTGRTEQHLVLFEFREAHLAVAERRQCVTSGSDDDEFLGEQGRGDQLLVVDRGIHHGEVKLAAFEQACQRKRGGVDHRGVDIRVAPVQLVQKRRQQPPAGGPDDAEMDVAGDMGRHRRHVGSHGGNLAVDALDACQHHLALGRQGPHCSIHEHRAQLFLEFRNMARHVGLHGVQRSCGCREAAMSSNCRQRIEVLQVHSATLACYGWLISQRD